MRLRRAQKERSSDPEPAGTYAVHAIGKVNDETHAAALALVDSLVAMASPLASSDARPTALNDKAPPEGPRGSPLSA
jgi:hypothetical protein